MHKTIGILAGLLAIGGLLFWSFSKTGSKPEDKQRPLRIFAASSMAYVLEDARLDIEKSTGIPVVIIEAASSTLARQVEEGAPGDVFITVNETWLEFLDDSERLKSVPLNFARNSLVLTFHSDSHFEECRARFVAPADAQTLVQACPYKGRIATGDPDHVPLGIYALEAIEYYGWDFILAPAQNARAAVALLESGATEAAVLYKTDMLSASGKWVWYPISEDSHTPIRYWAVALKQSNADATENFLNFLQSDAFKTILRARGFEVD